MSLSRRRFVQTVSAGTAGMWIAGRGREASLFDLGFEAQLNAQGTSPIILASNENPLGPGRAVLDAVRASFTESGRYQFANVAAAQARDPARRDALLAEYDAAWPGIVRTREVMELVASAEPDTDGGRA